MLKNEIDKRQMTSTLPSPKNDSVRIAEIKSNSRHLRSLLCAVIFGMLFGLFMNKAMVFPAPTIRLQMLFERFAILKMFLAAVGVSMLSVTIATLCQKSLYENILNDYIEHNNRRGRMFVDRIAIRFNHFSSSVYSIALYVWR